MEYSTSALCDIYLDQVDVVEPMLSNFGGRASFAGQITTVKCFEDNGVIREILEQDGLGRVLLVDGGGSLRRALIDAELARLAEDNEWEGIVRRVHVDESRQRRGLRRRGGVFGRGG